MELNTQKDFPLSIFEEDSLDDFIENLNDFEWFWSKIFVNDLCGIFFTFGVEYFSLLMWNISLLTFCDWWRIEHGRTINTTTWNVNFWISTFEARPVAVQKALTGAFEPRTISMKPFGRSASMAARAFALFSSSSNSHFDSPMFNSHVNSHSSSRSTSHSGLYWKISEF